MHCPQERAQSLFTNHWRAGDDELCPPELIIMRMSSDVSRWGQFFQGDFGNNPGYKACITRMADSTAQFIQWLALIDNASPLNDWGLYV